MWGIIYISMLEHVTGVNGHKKRNIPSYLESKRGESIMHWQIKPIVFFLAMNLVACSPKENMVVCKLSMAIPDHSDETILKLNQFLSNFWTEYQVSGWTLYPAFGAWRHHAPQPFIYEDSIIIELLGNKNLTHQSEELAVALEGRYAQDEVLVYCQEL